MNKFKLFLSVIAMLLLGSTAIMAQETRYYFFSSRETLPADENLVSVDLRIGKGTFFEGSLNGMEISSEATYTSCALKGSWFSFNQKLNAATDMSALAGGGYLVIKMRTTVDQQSFNIRLNNAGECWMVSSGNLNIKHDGTWEQLILPFETSSKTLTYTSSMSGIIFQIHANGSKNTDKIDIDYAYLTNDITNIDEGTVKPEPAPTNVTATATVTATEWDKVTLNLKANCEKSTVVTYEVTYGSTTKTFTGNAGATTTCVIEGLEGSTEYTFSVVAKNEDGVAADAVTTNSVTTPDKPVGMEIRYYFYRGNNIDPLPNSETLKSVDARPSAYAKLGGQNMNVNTEISDYTRFDIHNDYSKQVHTLTTTIPNSINDSYYLVVRFKTDMSTPNGNLSLNLSDALGQFPINNTETITYNDEKWHIVKFQLKDCKGTTPLPSAYLQENGVGLQVFMSKGAKNGEYFDIDYAYLTNDATKVDEGTVADIPTGPVSPQDAPGTRYYIVGEGSDATLHKSVDCTITYGNLAHQDTRVSDYYSMKTGNHDWTEITFKSNTTVANTIDAYESSNWHLIMRFRSSIDNYILGFNNFQVNLKNQEGNFTINSSEYVTYGDGQWHTVKFKLSATDKKTPVQYLQAGQIAAQVYVPNHGDYLQKDEFFDIDYLYFTNEVVEDNGTQDGYKILLRDTKDNTALLNTYNVQTVDVDLNRSFVADGAWYTLCLPFSMTADQVNAAFGACKLAKLNSSELRGSSLIHLNFDYVNTIEAGVPYLFMPMADVKPVIIEDVVIDNTLRPVETTYFNMNGIFYPTHVATGDYFLGTDNYLYPVQETDNSSMKGLRAYFTMGAGAPASAQARVVMAPTVTTDLPENTITNTAEKVIKDGTIYILRGDKIYTTTGQLVK